MQTYFLCKQLLCSLLAILVLQTLDPRELYAFIDESNQGNKTKYPNVLVFLSDDQGWGDFGFQGNTNFQTPNLDQLADTGTVCQRFYVCPVCAPTRAEFLTGRYHPRGSAMGVTQGDERLDLDETTLAERLKSTGYATGAFGKWHNGSQYPYHPNARGFDEFYGFCSGHWGDYFSPPLERNVIQVKGNGFVADDFTDHAIDFIRQHSTQPFFCYLAFNTPHSPMQVPDHYMDAVKKRQITMKHQGRSGEKEDDATTLAAIAMVENIDWNVGRILKALDELNIRQETIIIYFNDNGPNSFRWNAGMKGRKGTLDEGGVRSPLIINWPGKIPPDRRIDQLTGAVDITPTLCELAGIPIPSDPEHPLDGISIAPQILNPTHSVIERTLYTHWSGRIAMRQGPYLLDPDGSLFNVVNDPTQQSNLAESEATIRQSMSEAVQRWREEVLRSAQANRPFIIGHPKRPVATLPAQDGKCKGPTVKRSDTAPNCSFFTNIRSTEDRLTWEIEPLQTGTYSVWISYTASAEAVGKHLKISVLDDELTNAIQTAFDSPLRGKENDRVQRKSESLMKDFKQVKLGVMNLKAQRGSCEIRLTDPITEGGFIEIQSVEFRKEPQQSTE